MLHNIELTKIDSGELLEAPEHIQTCIGCPVPGCTGTLKATSHYRLDMFTKNRTEIIGYTCDRCRSLLITEYKVVE